MYCPIMSYQTNQTVDDGEGGKDYLAIAGKQSCLKTECAWWVEKSEEYKMGGQCAIYLIAKNYLP